MNHSGNLDQYFKERSWVLNSINRGGRLAYNVCTQDQTEVLLVDYYPKSGRAYLHLKTLQRHNVEFKILCLDPRSPTATAPFLTLASHWIRHPD